MTIANRHRWKEIIGPEYDTVVKTYIKLVRAIKVDSEKNKLILTNRYIKILNTPTQEPQESFDVLHNDVILKRFPSIKPLIDVLHDLDGRIKFEPDKLRADLISIANNFPEPSKTFFIHEIKKKNKQGRRARTREQIGRDKKKGIAILGAFIVRQIFLAIDSDIIEDNGGGQLLENRSLLTFFVEWMQSTISQLAHQKTVEELLLKGTDTGIINAVRIDKSAVGADLVKRRIIQAQLSGDSKFLNRLAENLAAKPLQNEAEYHEAYIVMRTFWKAGLCLLGPQDMDHFLTACDIIHPSYPTNLPQFIKQHIRSIPGN